MKNLMKAALIAMLFTAFASCKSSGRNGAEDSVANNPDTAGTSTTVDTMPITIDTTKTDTTTK